MKSLYCEECGEYLMAGSGSLVDCHCGWKQPTDEGIDAADYEALQAECEKLRKDAERYRALRAMRWHSSPLAVARNPKVAIRPGHDCPSGDRLDNAIDAAMQGDES